MAGEKANFNAQLKVEQQQAVGNELSSVPTLVQQTTVGDSGQLTPASTPPVDAVWSDRHPLAAATDTLDLSALPRAGGLAAVDLTGKRIRVMKLAAPAANADPITVGPGAVQGYADFPTVELAPGEAALFVFTNADVADAKTPVAAGDTVDVSGTAGDNLDVVLAAG